MHLVVEFWNDAARKGGPADFINDFVFSANLPKSNRVLVRRRQDAGVWQVQRADTLEWVSENDYRDNLFGRGVTLVMDTFTPEEWVEKRIREHIEAYAQRRGGKAGPRDATDKALDAMPDESARLEQVFRDIPQDVDEPVSELAAL